MVLNAMVKEKTVVSVNTEQITLAVNVITTDNTKNNIKMRNFNHYVIFEVTLKSLYVVNFAAFGYGMVALIFNVIAGV